MTIAGAYLVSEGVVLGADSTSTITIPRPGNRISPVSQLLNHAQKLFELGEPGQSRMGVATWGHGRVGRTSHRTILARLADRVEANQLSVLDAANSLVELVNATRDPKSQPQPATGYFLGGWNHSTHDPECYSIVFDPARGTTVKALGIGEPQFAGAPQFFHRILRGFDPGLPGALLAKLRERLDTLPVEFDSHFWDAFNAAAMTLHNPGAGDIPIREAIDFVHANIHLTIKAFKFRLGPPIVGGPIEVGFVSTDRPFRWVTHKSFDSAAFEQEPMQ